MRDPRSLHGAWASFQSHGFVEPAPALRCVVSRYWWARWDLTGQPDYVQLMVPYPNVQLTFSGDERWVRGVSRGRVTRALSGRGSVVGVAFRPGVFRRFLGAPVESITDLSVAANTIFPGAAHTTDIADLDEFLSRRLPAADPIGDEVAGWVDDIVATRELQRVDQLTGRYNVSERQLQRLFAEHVGVGPKWVLRRFRLHEVTERMAGRSAVDWAVLAADLGYADQAHLTRDFSNMFGEPPTSYAARY
ncbi:helix-turn-helix domain-containing protein [Dactylosporangium vinaceum]|uniref:DUF6597 domain-containing transcriptional factor n=1 Tax=Dactylosporangium vinaceum TaxID=53362 RepID=A0ABV5MFZ4_9ACTN|nr:helix-turn-helix domain-containing protein [Dactylosporangium vinaceum]